jgi:hypothetical protein
MPGWESMAGLVKILEGWCGKKVDGRVLSGSVNDARVFVPLFSSAGRRARSWSRRGTMTS